MFTKIHGNARSVMEKKREFLRGNEDDIEKAKHLEKKPLDADWLQTDNGRGDQWGDGDKTKTREGKPRSWSQAVGHTLYAGLLLTEIVLWIMVLEVWRYSPKYTYFFHALVPVLLPSIVIPGLSILHTITRGRLSFKESLLFLLPPSPIALHLALVFKALSTSPGTYAEIVRQNRACRIAGIVQAFIMSFPLVILSFKTILLGSMENNSIDAGSFHIHIYENKFMFVAASVSLLNMLVAAYQYNERLTGRPVAVLVGIPFLFSTILFRIIGLGLLFSLFEEAWIFLCLGIMFAMSAISVQLASNFTICGRIFRSVFGDHGSSSSPEKKSSIFSSLLLSLAGVILPVGYCRDARLGHVSGRGWRLILVNSVGSMAILCTVISQAIVQYIPNTISGQQIVSMMMNLAEMEVTIKTQGKEITLDLPKTQLTMLAGNPLRGSLTLSHHDDIYISYIVPALFCMLVLPFTLLRIILLGWDCRLERSRDEQDIFSERRRSGVSSGRSCCAVMWSISALMSFTTLTSLVAGVWTLCTVLAHVQPIQSDSL